MTLGLSPGQRVYRVRRLRTAGGEALAVEESTLSAQRLGDAAAPPIVQDVSLYALLQSRGAAPVRALRQLRAVNADEDLAGLLGVPLGSALLATERVAWDAAGRGGGTGPRPLPGRPLRFRHGAARAASQLRQF